MLRRELLKSLVALVALPLAPFAKLVPRRFCTGGIVRGHFHNPEPFARCYFAGMVRMPMIEYNCDDKWRNRSYNVDMIVDEKAHQDEFFQALVDDES